MNRNIDFIKSSHAKYSLFVKVKKIFIKKKIKQIALILFYFLLALGITLATHFIFVKLDILPDSQIFMNSYHIFLMVLSQAFIFLILAFLWIKFFSIPYFGLSRQSFSQSFSKIFKNFFKLEITFREILLAFFFYILVMIFISLLMKFVLKIEVHQFAEFNISKLQENPFFFLLSVACIAPLYEEIIFRGILLRIFISKNFINKKIETTMGVIISSLIFAGFHFDLTAFIPLFILSLYLSALTIYKKGIALSIFIHALNNFFSGLGLLYLELS